MIKALIGRKIGMTQVFKDDGSVVSVTVLKAGPCVVVEKKIDQTDGYNAIKLGFEDVKSFRLNKPDLGQFTKNNLSPKRVLKEFKFSGEDNLKVGDTVDASIFNDVESVSITGTSKGKGFQGVVKRWGFGGGKDTHGSNFHRAPGSIGQSSYPSKVFKGLKLPGHMGDVKSTVLNLKIVKINIEENLIFVKGAVPGFNNSIIHIYGANSFGRKLGK